MRPGQLISLIIISIMILVPVEAQPILSTSLNIVSSEITENEYWIQTNSLITIVDMEVVFTGLTSFDVEGFEQDLMGDLFIIIDGIPERVTGIENGLMQLPLTKGYHPISLLYMGKDNSGFEYSLDTIYVDLSSSYSKPDLIAYDFDYSINDDVVVGEQIEQKIISTDYSYLVRDLTLNGGITANISVNENKIDGIFKINSFGSDSSQLEEQFPATRGQVFFTDDLGIHRDPSQLYFEDDVKIGVLVVHEAGVMLGDDYDGIMLNDATGSFDFHIEYQSFGYEEEIPDTTPTGSEETIEEQSDIITTNDYTPMVSIRETTFTSNEEKSPTPLIPFISTLVILRRRKR